jgi:hypothetical protein
MEKPEQVQQKLSELSRGVWLAGAVELAFGSGLLAQRRARTSW